MVKSLVIPKNSLEAYTGSSGVQDVKTMAVLVKKKPLSLGQIRIQGDRKQCMHSPADTISRTSHTISKA